MWQRDGHTNTFCTIFRYNFRPITNCPSSEKLESSGKDEERENVKKIASERWGSYGNTHSSRKSTNCEWNEHTHNEAVVPLSECCKL